MNETDHLEPGWQRESGGVNYEKLLEVKRKCDPDGPSVCHHGVGSEAWSSNGRGPG